MEHTVIGVFNSETEANNAVNKLENDGFSRSNIDISDKGNYSASNYGGDTDRSTVRNEDNDSFGDKVSRFFDNLFGDDRESSTKYTTAAKRGCVVTVHAKSSEEAERASDLLDLYGAVDVDDAYSNYGNTANRSDFNSDSFTSRSDYTSTGSVVSDLADDAYTTRSNFDTDENLRTDITEDNLNYRSENQYDDLREDTADMERTSEFNRPSEISDFDRPSENENKFNVIEENMEVGKKEVETGGVRVRSRIIEKPVEESLRLRSERVVVERNPVDRPATEADLNDFREQEFEMTEHKEVPVVNKEARVVEEVRVGKEVENREETIRDTVRRTDVDVDNIRNEEERTRWEDPDRK